ncbi:MAG: glycine cleavage system protein GcvH [Theionarchaea archaeon]|nr:glycine cleavage system protein GcvH [Theionarchaea archaeon]
MVYEVKKGLYYTKDHEWVHVENGTGKIGISHYAAAELGDIAYIELPKLKPVKQGGKLCEIESVKAVSDIFSPVSGEITAVNNDLMDSPERINEDPYGSWIATITLANKGELENLMTSEAYTAYLSSLK